MDSYLTDQITRGLHFTLRTAKVEKPRECSLSYQLDLKGNRPNSEPARAGSVAHNTNSEPEQSMKIG